jgi:hypothetical protein
MLSALSSGKYSLENRRFLAPNGSSLEASASRYLVPSSLDVLHYMQGGADCQASNDRMPLSKNHRSVGRFVKSSKSAWLNDLVFKEIFLRKMIEILFL